MPTIDASLRQNGGNYSIGGNSCRYIVVHYTGAPGSAKATATWSHRDAHGSSYHYVLDGSGTIWQTMRDTDTAWAVGAWAGCSQLIRNNESISIEVCSAGADFTAAEISELRWLVQRLMREHHIPASRVVRHWDCHTGRKLCPAPYCGSAANDAKWAQLHKTITEGEEVTNEDIKAIADAVWARYLGSVRAIDRVQGIDLYMPGRVWDEKLPACGGKSKQKFAAQEYLTNADDRLVKLTARMDAIEAKLDKLLKAVK